MLFLPRRWRIACFFIVTPWQLVVILTANYTFLNYLVLMLGFLLLDDRLLLRFLPQGWKKSFGASANLRAAGDLTASHPPLAINPQGMGHPHAFGDGCFEARIYARTFAVARTAFG